MKEESERGFAGHRLDSDAPSMNRPPSTKAVPPAILEIARLMGALVALEESKSERGE